MRDFRRPMAIEACSIADTIEAAGESSKGRGSFTASRGVNVDQEIEAKAEGREWARLCNLLEM